MCIANWSVMRIQIKEHNLIRAWNLNATDIKGEESPSMLNTTYKDVYVILVSLSAPFGYKDVFLIWSKSVETPVDSRSDIK